MLYMFGGGVGELHSPCFCYWHFLFDPVMGYEDMYVLYGWKWGRELDVVLPWKGKPDWGLCTVIWGKPYEVYILLYGGKLLRFMYCYMGEAWLWGSCMIDGGNLCGCTLCGRIHVLYGLEPVWLVVLLWGTLLFVYDCWYIICTLHVACTLVTWFGGCGKGLRGKEPYWAEVCSPPYYIYFFRVLPELGGATPEVLHVLLVWLLFVFSMLFTMLPLRGFWGWGHVSRDVGLYLWYKTYMWLYDDMTFVVLCALMVYMHSIHLFFPFASFLRGWCGESCHGFPVVEDRGVTVWYRSMVGLVRT